jgi:hypothetical protein
VLVRLASVGVLSGVLAACGGVPAATTPTTPTAPAPASGVENQSPGIAGVSITPALGVSQLTAFHAHVNATDPDGDPVSIAWSSYGTPLGDRSDVDFTGCSCPPPSPSIVSPVFVLTGQFEPAAKPSPFLSDYTARGRVSGGTYDGQTFIFGIHDPY